MLILGGKAVEHHNNKDLLKNTAFTVTVALQGDFFITKVLFTFRMRIPKLNDT